MARAREQKNGRLEEALTTLLQTQASFVAQLRESDKEMADLRRQQIREWADLRRQHDQQMAELRRELHELRKETAERFSRIEAILLEHSRILADHSRILADHSRILERLPEAVREKIGFKAP